MLDTKTKFILTGKTFKKTGNYILKSVNESALQKSNDDEESCCKRRYIASLLGFIAYVILASYRMVMSISIISMVGSSTNFNYPDALNASNLTETHEEFLPEEEESKFDWNPVVQGHILGASFLGCFLTVGISGKAAERFGAKVMIISSTLISAVCTVMTPFSAYCHVYFLIFLQFVRGLSQGFVLTAVSVLMANWLPRTERGHLSALVNSGVGVGMLVGGSLSGFLCECTSIGGWKSVFYIFGIAGILISVHNMFYLHEFPRDDPEISSSELKYILSNQENVLTSRRPNVPWKKVLSSVPVYVLMLAAIGKNWAFCHFAIVHPKFLYSVLNFPIRQNGVVASVPFIIQTVLIYSASYFSLWLQRKKYLDVNTIRKLWNTIGAIGYSSCLALIMLSDYERTVTLVCSIIMVPLYGVQNLGCAIVPNDLSPTFAGTLRAMSTGASMVTGFIIPLVVGALMKEEESTNQWTIFFLISIAISMSTGIAFAVFGSADVQEWNFSNNERDNTKEYPKEEKNIPSEDQDRTDRVNHM